VGEWFSFAPKGAPFSVTLPVTPTEKPIEIESGTKGRSFDLESGGNEYRIAWISDLPEGKQPAESLKVVLKRTVEDLLKLAKQRGKRRLVRTQEKETALGRYSGRELLMESANDKLDARGYVVGRDIVVLAVMHSKGQEASFEATRFFQSLSISDSGKADGVGRESQSTAAALDAQSIPLEQADKILYRRGEGYF